MKDFRRRFGIQLGGASRRLSAPAQEDFRARFGASLAVASAALAREREAAALAGDFRARLGVQLGVAAAALAPARMPAQRRRVRVPVLGVLGRLSRPVAIGLSLTVLAGAATAASIWLPQLGNPTYHYNPGASGSAPPADELAALSILSAPQTDADRGPLAQAALEYVNNFTTGVRTNYVHVLVSQPDLGVVLVPVERRSQVNPGSEPVPGGANPAPIDNALCLYAANSVDPSAASAEVVDCWSLRQVLDAGAFELVPGNHVVGLAPDGVSAVTVHAGAVSATAQVSDNAFAVTIPPSAQAPSVPTVTYQRPGS